MLIITLGQAVFVPVMLTDTASQSPAVGVLYNNVQATVVKNDGTAVDLTLGPTDWTQITQGAYSSKGYYLLKLPASVLDQEGNIHFGVAVAGNDFFPGLASVRANTEKQIYDRIGAPVLADISHDIQVISASTGTGGFGPTDRDNLLAVKAKTDNLPADPTSQATTNAAVAATFTATDHSNLLAVKTKTDNLPAIPASQSDVTNARDNVNSNTNSQASSINSNTNSRASEIKGASFTTGDDLHSMKAVINGINTKTTNLPSDPASQSVICGAGFDPSTDALHQLQLASSAASSGGFGVQDRADLQTIKTQANLIGTSTVATQADVVNNTAAARDAMMGVDTTNSPYNVKRTISEVYVYARNYINPKTTNLPSDPASNSVVNSVGSAVEGSGFVGASDSLHAIASAITASNYTSADRTLMNNIYSRLGAPTGASMSADIAGVKTTGDNNRSDVIAIRAKTDNLPGDPASNSHVDLVTGAGADAWNANDREMMTEIKAKTDRLPIDPASQSAGFGTTDRDNMVAIRYKTDALPVDPASITSVTNLSNKVGTPRSTVAADIQEVSDFVVANG